MQEKIIDCEIKAEFNEFSLPKTVPQNICAIIPTYSRTETSRFGAHCYYFYNFKTLKGFSLRIKHKDIIIPGLKKLKDANYKQYKFLPLFRMFFQKFHYGFNFFEQIMLMTVPHTVTPIGESRFIICLWSYYGFLVVDCKKKTVTYKMIDKNTENHLFGSRQLYDANTNSLYYMTFSAKDSLKKTLNPFDKVFSRILRHDLNTQKTEEIWTGIFADYMHDLLISENNRYLVVCDMGRFTDQNDQLIPSRLLVLDLYNNKEWLIRDIPNAAHVLIDPDDSEVIYFSNHNFQFIHTPFFELLKTGSYTLKFFGPASVHKYRITPDGPKELGIFNDPDLFRMTNFHIFQSEGRKILAAMGAPNFIFIVDPKDMKFISKIEIKNPDAPSYIGTFSPSPDGKELFVQTTRSFQIVDISSGTSDMIISLPFNHTCSNHMELANDTDW